MEANCWLALKTRDDGMEDAFNGVRERGSSDFEGISPIFARLLTFQTNFARKEVGIWV